MAMANEDITQGLRVSNAGDSDAAQSLARGYCTPSTLSSPDRLTSLFIL
jgi:hypothetical protein